MGGAAAALLRNQTPHAEPSGRLPARIRAQRHGQRHRGALGARRRRDERHRMASRPRTRRTEPHQEQVDALRGVRPDALPARTRHRRRRERPRRTDHAAARPAAQPHRAAGHRRTARGGRRAVRTRAGDPAGRQRPDLSDARRTAGAAREVPRGRRLDDGRQFRRSLHRSAGRLHERRQRRSGHVVRRPAHRHHGHREGDSRHAGAGGLHAPAGPLGHGAAAATSSWWTTAARSGAPTRGTATCSNACAAAPA